MNNLLMKIYNHQILQYDNDSNMEPGRVYVNIEADNKECFYIIDEGEKKLLLARKLYDVIE